MKNFLFLIALAPMALFAQKKGDNAIVIMDSNVTMENIVGVLVKKGFLLENNTANYISTHFKGIGPTSEKIAVYKNGDSIILRAYLNKEVREGVISTTYDVRIAEWKGLQTNVNKIVFNDLKEIAALISSKFVYTKYN